MISNTPQYLQCIRGPLILITIGVLFALHQANVISFAQTWPLILIVLGVLKLGERMAVRNTMPPPGRGGRY